MGCILCSQSLKEYAPTSYMNLPVYYCEKCNLYSTGNSETEIKQKLKENYQESQWVGTDHYKIMLQSDYNDPESQGKRRQWISQFAYAKSFMNNKKLLEIGTGAGQTINWFEENGFSVMGIEPDAKSVELINRRLKHGHCVTGFAEEISLDEKFDIIWLSHVFEHLIRPDLFLEKCKDSLNDDGIIFVEVPNCENETVLQLSIDEPSTFHFSKRSLEILGRKQGYNIIKSDYFRSPTLVEGGLNKIIKKIFSKNLYSYYPKIITKNKRGTDIRIILKR